MTSEKELPEKPPEQKDEVSKPGDQLQLKVTDWIEEMHQAKSLELQLKESRRISAAQALEAAKTEISRIATLVIGYMVKLHPFIEKDPISGELERFEVALGRQEYDARTGYLKADCKDITPIRLKEEDMIIMEVYYGSVVYFWYGTGKDMMGVELSGGGFYLTIMLGFQTCNYAIKDLSAVDDIFISQMFKLLFDYKKMRLSSLRRSEKLVDDYIKIDGRSILFVNPDEMGKSGAYEASSKREAIPPHVRREVWRRDEGKCVRCDSGEKLEFDHIIPLSRGGSNTERNIELLCERCNRKKHAKIE